MMWTLTVGPYETDVLIGFGAERSKHQKVVFTVSVQFSKEPLACNSDKLDEAVCYAEICHMIDRVCAGGPFHLIESLAKKSFHAISNHIPTGSDLTVRIHKLTPPVEGLTGGASFEIRSKVTSPK